MIIEELNDGEIYFAKGHVDHNEFVQALSSEIGIPVSELEPIQTKHSLARRVPGQKGYAYDYYVYFDQKPGRGAFKVTYVYL